MKKSDPPIIVEELFDRPVDEVWEAITKVEHMVSWFFENIPNFEARSGFKTEFDVFSGERKFTHQWEILEAVPNEKIVYDWRYPDYDGVGKVVFELSDDHGKTKLRLTNLIIEDFQEGIPEFNREACEGGWNYFINNRLKNYL